jgi:hypothetical protein
MTSALEDEALSRVLCPPSVNSGSYAFQCFSVVLALSKSV